MEASQTSNLLETPPTDLAPSKFRQVGVSKTNITTLYDGSGRDVKDAIVDIIFVHGLGGGPETTWSTSEPAAPPGDQQTLSSSSTRRYLDRIWSKSNGEKSTINIEGSPTRPKHEIFWPADFLPAAFPQARILTWGYDSKVTLFFSGPADQGSYYSHAKDLLYDVNDIRANNSRKRPIIWIAHSLGGIIVKEALLRAQSGVGDNSSRSLKDIYESTRKVLFLGTPHRGSSMAQWAIIAERLVKAAGFDTNPVIIKQLKNHSPELGNLNERFISLFRSQNFDVTTFQEAREMEGMYGLNGKVIEDFSSTIADETQRTIPANHKDMCKFSSKYDTGYRRIEAELRQAILLYWQDLPNATNATSQGPNTFLETDSEFSQSSPSNIPTIFSTSVGPVTILSTDSSAPQENIRPLTFNIGPSSSNEAIVTQNRPSLETEDVEEEHISERSAERVGESILSSTSSMMDQSIKQKAHAMILEVLQEDEELNPLLKDALKQFERQRVVKNLANFISGYCVLLSHNQPNQNQKKAIRFLRRRSFQFSSLLCYNLDPTNLEIERVSGVENAKANAADRKAWLDRWISGRPPTGSPARSIASDDEQGSDNENLSSSDSEDLPPGFDDIRAFLVQGQPLELFRKSFAAFVTGDSINDWNSMIKAKVKRKQGPIRGNIKMPRTVPDAEPTELREGAVVELREKGAFQVHWRCRCGRKFEALIPGTRLTAEKFFRRIDWNEKMDGPMVKLYLKSDWIERFFWTMAPNLLPRFSFEIPTRHGDDPANQIDLEGLRAPRVSAGTLPGFGFSQNGTTSMAESASQRGETDQGDELIYICLFDQNRGERRLKHAKLHRRKVAPSLSPCTGPGVQGFNAPAVESSTISDKTLFTALREKILRNRASRALRWLNLLVPMEISGITLWEFKLYHASKLVVPVTQGKLPYEPSPSVPQPTPPKLDEHRKEWDIPELNGEELVEYKELIKEGAYLLHLLKYPNHAHNDSRVWNGLPRKIKTKLINLQSTPKLGWGFQVDYQWNAIAFSICMCPIILIGCILATCLCIKYKWPISAGITLASAPVTLVMTANTLLGGITKQEGLSK